jgi:hypothetical protein
MPLKAGLMLSRCARFAWLATTLMMAQQQKYWMADHADLIVVGRFQSASERKTSTGYYIEGEIVPKETLFGPPVRRKLKYEWLCSCCRPSPNFDILTKTDAIWFFMKLRSGHWSSAAQTCSDPGYRPLDERSEVRTYLAAHPRVTH